MFDIIIPTCNRASLLARVLPYYVAQKGVARIVIVEDGPQSEQIACLARGSGVPEIVVVATGVQSGAPAAKRYGLKFCKSAYAAFGEDDAFPAPNYYNTLLGHLRNGRADVVSGAVHYLAEINPSWSEGSLSYVADQMVFCEEGATEGLVFGPATLALFMARRSDLECYPPDDRYKGNGWREETDPLISMWGEGKRVALDRSAIVYHLPRVFQLGGGQHKYVRAVYEYWCFYNDMVFYKKHGVVLARIGFYGPAVKFALGQLISRWKNKLATTRSVRNVSTSMVELPRLESYL